MTIQANQGQYAEMLQEMYALLLPRVSEVFRPVLLQGAGASGMGCSQELLTEAVNGALEKLTWQLFEAWGTILWDAAEADPANLLRLETLDRSMLPRGDISARLALAAKENGLLTEARIREVLRRLGKSMPSGTFLPPLMAELMRLEGRLAVTCH